MKIARKEHTRDGESVFGLTGSIVIQILTFLNVQSHLRVACTNKSLNFLSKAPDSWFRIDSIASQLRHFSGSRPVVLCIHPHRSLLSIGEIARTEYSDSDYEVLKEMLPSVRRLVIPLTQRLIDMLSSGMILAHNLRSCSFDMQGSFDSLRWTPKFTEWLILCPLLDKIVIENAHSANFIDPQSFRPVAPTPTVSKHLPISRISFGDHPAEYTELIHILEHLKHLRDLDLSNMEYENSGGMLTEVLTAISRVIRLKELNLGSMIRHGTLQILSELILSRFAIDMTYADPYLVDSDLLTIARWPLVKLSIMTLDPHPATVSGHAARNLWKSLHFIQDIDLKCWGPLRDELSWLANVNNVTSIAVEIEAKWPKYAYPPHEACVELHQLVSRMTHLKHIHLTGQTEDKDVLLPMLDTLLSVSTLWAASIFISAGSTMTEDVEIRARLHSLSQRRLYRGIDNDEWINVLLQSENRI